jgi:hypothetical protein
LDLGVRFRAGLTGSAKGECVWGGGGLENKREGKKGVRGCSTGTSREVTHPSTIPAQRRLTAEF